MERFGVANEMREGVSSAACNVHVSQIRETKRKKRKRENSTGFAVNLISRMAVEIDYPIQFVQHLDLLLPSTHAHARLKATGERGNCGIFKEATTSITGLFQFTKLDIAPVKCTSRSKIKILVQRIIFPVSNGFNRFKFRGGVRKSGELCILSTDNVSCLRTLRSPSS